MAVARLSLPSSAGSSTTTSHVPRYRVGVRHPPRRSSPGGPSRLEVFARSAHAAARQIDLRTADERLRLPLPRGGSTAGSPPSKELDDRASPTGSASSATRVASNGPRRVPRSAQSPPGADEDRLAVCAGLNDAVDRRTRGGSLLVPGVTTRAAQAPRPSWTSAIVTVSAGRPVASMSPSVLTSITGEPARSERERGFAGSARAFEQRRGRVPSALSSRASRTAHRSTSTMSRERSSPDIRGRASLSTRRTRAVRAFDSRETRLASVHDDASGNGLARRACARTSRAISAWTSACRSTERCMRVATAAPHRQSRRAARRDRRLDRRTSMRRRWRRSWIDPSPLPQSTDPRHEERLPNVMAREAPSLQGRASGCRLRGAPDERRRAQRAPIARVHAWVMACSTWRTRTSPGAIVTVST